MHALKSMKRLLSLSIALVMLFGMIPVQAAAETNADSTQNNVSTPVEEWNYTTGLQTSLTAQTLLADGDSAGSSADIVKVTVTAVDRNSGETVTVPGADVNLYVGTNLISTTTSGSDGMAEVSLAGLTIEQRQNATISANKVVSRGKAINGSARDNLFANFPKGDDGEYYRYTMELHSETIDGNGNWLGAKIPMSKESNKVDIVFIIDATGSMSDEINNVRTNIASFSENLINSGLDIRFCIIDYRDITLVSEDANEDTHVYTISGSHWMNDIDSVVDTLASIDATGGGDGPESVLDPLGYVADNSLMQWRSDAYRFAFVLTDADYKTDNNHGYSSMAEVTAQLADMDVVTSVITSSSYQSTYADLYETTGGIYADIYSSTFDEEMLALSDSIIESVTRDMTLNLSEPRLLVNMSVCYLANDSTSKSNDYKEAVKNVMNEYAHRLAETTDGHVMLDKVLLFSTANRTNFYNPSQQASMADIRIETRVKDDGKGLSNVTIRSNAHATGFYSDSKYTAASSKFNNLKDGTGIDGSRSFYRIQLSGTTDGWEVSFTNKDDVYEYSTTIMHEAGHYLLGFFDEYLDANGNTWNDGDGKLETGESQWSQPYFGPDGDTVYGGYGLMDNHHYGDIEISKAAVDYAYMTGGFSSADTSLHTNQSYKNGGSCEDSLATLLTDPSFSSYYYKSIISNSDFELGNYALSYTKAANDRTAKYSYAGLSDSDFLSVPSSGADGRSTTLYSDGTEPVFTSDSVADVTFTSNEETITIAVSGDAIVSIMKAGEEAFTDVALSEGTAELPIVKGELAEIRVAVTGGDATRYNAYYIDRSENTDSGYVYTSADDAVMAYVTTSGESSYTFIADNTSYENGEYRSMNQATWITSDNGAGFDSGEIYSVADYLAEIDYTTLSWFKYADGEWTALATDCSEEENMNIGARADLNGEGLYVLMAKESPVGGISAAANLRYTQSEDRDAVVTLTFDDPNSNSKYYNVYYSESEFTDKNADGVVVRSFPAKSQTLLINLLERGRTVYAAVEIVAEDGCRSDLSDIILIGGEADSDGDGIPDWYCDKYHLWGKDGEDKDIANSDDDGDGLTNLEEYQGGSDPTNPNDPVHTTNIPVESITLSETELALNVGDTAEVTATVMPENASNKNVTWRSADTKIATVKVTDGVCTITAVAEGETQIYAVTADGGYSATIDITVGAAAHEHSYTPVVTNPTCTEQGYTTYTCDCGDSYVSDYVDPLGSHNYVDSVCTICGDCSVKRIYGANRFETAFKVADEMKENLGITKFEAIVVASGSTFADALPGSYLANTKGAPILLSWMGDAKYEYLNDDVVSYIQENLVEGGIVYILGSSSAVPTTIDSALESSGIVSKRLAGSNRFETNLEILKEAGVATGKDILVCTGTNFADSLSASATGNPILMVYNESGKLTDSQKEYLSSLKYVSFCIIGDESAVCKKLETELSEYGQVSRLAGKNRFETSVLVAQKYFAVPENVVLAYAWNFPDGLCGGGLAYSMGAPLILTMTKYESYGAANYVATEELESGLVLGSAELISDNTVRNIFQLKSDVTIKAK